MRRHVIRTAKEIPIEPPTRRKHATKFSAIIAAALVGAAIAAAPAVADNHIVLKSMPQANGDNTVDRPDFLTVVQQNGQFFALVGGQDDAACSGGGRNCVVRYDWTEGVWTAKGMTQPPIPPGYRPKSIATDGTNLVVVQSDIGYAQIDRVYYSPDNGATWAESTITKRNGQPLGVTPNGNYTTRMVYSGDGFIVYGAKADFENPSPPIVSTDGGANFGPATGIDLGPSQGVVGVASDTGSGIAWTTRPDAGGSRYRYIMTDGFDRIRWNKDISKASWVANLGPASYVVATNGSAAWYRGAVGQDLVPAAASGSYLSALFAAPEVSADGVFQIRNDSDLYLRKGTAAPEQIGYANGIKWAAVYGNLIMMTGYNGAWAVAYNKDELPSPDFGVDAPDLPELERPPLIPPPDFPAVIDEDHSVIMPELGVSPKDEDGKPVMAPATATAPAVRWNPDATAYCEWRKKNVACVSEMNPLPEATGNYTLKANLSGTSVSRKGACRWTDTKPQCRVWLTEKGTWRLTWSGENDSRSVSGGRTVVVK